MEAVHPFLQQLHIPFLICSCDFTALLGSALSLKSNPVKRRCWQGEKYSVFSCHRVIFTLHTRKLQQANKFNTATLSLVCEIRKKKKIKAFLRRQERGGRISDLNMLTRRVWVG